MKRPRPFLWPGPGDVFLVCVPWSSYLVQQLPYRSHLTPVHLPCTCATTSSIPTSPGSVGFSLQISGHSALVGSSHASRSPHVFTVSSYRTELITTPVDSPFVLFTHSILQFALACAPARVIASGKSGNKRGSLKHRANSVQRSMATAVAVPTPSHLGLCFHHHPSSPLCRSVAVADTDTPNIIASADTSNACFCMGTTSC